VIATYHNHTTWSDGQATVAGMVEAAREQGLDEIGISDHWVLHPRGRTPFWSMDPDRLGEYVADVREVAAASEAPRVRVGLEVDWFPEHADAIAARLEEHEFDFLIGSVHEVRDFGLDSAAAPWDALPFPERDEMHRAYWRALADLARSGLFDLVGHLDLTKKFGHRPSADLSEEVNVALDAIASADMAAELNTAGWFKPCEEAYPSDALIRACRARDIPMLVNADAHEPGELARGLSRGRETLREAGCREVAVFARRERGAVALPQR
jgi:histidinol-phosphatase (PHP family)